MMMSAGSAHLEMERHCRLSQGRRRRRRDKSTGLREIRGQTVLFLSGPELSIILFKLATIDYNCETVGTEHLLICSIIRTRGSKDYRPNNMDTLIVCHAAFDLLAVQNFASVANNPRRSLCITVLRVKLFRTCLFEHRYSIYSFS